MSVSDFPIQPKRGWMLVELADDKHTVRASGIIIPRDADQAMKRATIVALGLPPVDFRSGIERGWDYEIGQQVVIADTVQAAAMPMEYSGAKVALVNEAHILATWVSPT